MRTRRTHNAPIGVMDSGIGGLSVIRQLSKMLPRERFIYIGDSGRFPYGNKPEKQITQHGLELAQFLHNHEVKSIVIACGTLSCYALEPIAKEFHLPTFGVIEPTARQLDGAEDKRAIVWATSATIKSGKYQQRLRKHKDIMFQSQPNLAEAIEFGETITSFETNSGLLVLGCTHYSWLRFTKPTATIDAANELAKEVKAKLYDAHLLSKQKLGLSEFYFTGKIKRRVLDNLFSQTAKIFQANLEGGIYVPYNRQTRRG